jgi:hypothetical protein
MTKKNKLISLILLLVLALLAALVAGTSVSRYVFDRDDTLQGSFTNLYFSHNGEGATAIMQEQGESYVGYISLTAFNSKSGNISARHIQYQVRAVSESDVTENDGRYFVKDPWGVSHELSDASAAQNRNYSVKPVMSDMSDYASGTSGGDFSEGQGYSVDDNGKVTLSFGSDAPEIDGVASPVADSRSDILKITRNAADDFESESFYIIIEIIQPYREIEIFKVNASTSLVAVGHTSGTAPDTHFGYNEIAVNIQTARKYSYTFNGEVDGTSYVNKEVSSLKPAKIEITWTSTSSAVIFDSGRLAINSEGNIDEITDATLWQNGWLVSSAQNSEGEYTTTVTLFLPHGSDITLYFYVPKQYECTVTASFNADNVVFPYQAIAGVDENGLLLTSSQS